MRPTIMTDSGRPRRTSLSPTQRRSGRSKWDKDPRIISAQSNDNSTSQLRVNTSASVDSSKLEAGIYSSPVKSSNSPRKGSSSSIMTEHEVSAMVQNTLARARQSSQSLSPRSSVGARSPSNRSNTLSPTSPSTHSATSGRPPIHSPSSLGSPGRLISSSSRTISVPSLNDIYSKVNIIEEKIRKQQASGASLKPMRSPKTLAEIYKRKGFGSSMSTTLSPSKRESSNKAPSFDEKSADNKEGMDVDTGLHLSMKSTLSDDNVDSMVVSGKKGKSTKRTSSSSDASDVIIKKVEEEIANARIAALEASKRLAGVSATLKKNKSRRPLSPEGPRSSLSKSMDTSKDDENRAIENKHDDDEIMSERSSGSTDTDQQFDEAINILSSEFEDDEEFDEIEKNRSNSIRDSRKDVSGKSSVVLEEEPIMEEKKEAEEEFTINNAETMNSSEEFSRIRTIDKYAMDFPSAEEQESTTIGNANLRAVFSVNKSTKDDTAVEELEMVLEIGTTSPMYEGEKNEDRISEDEKSLGRIASTEQEEINSKDNAQEVQPQEETKKDSIATDEQKRTTEKDVAKESKSTIDTSSDLSIAEDQATDIVDNTAHLANQLLTNLSEIDENLPPNDLSEAAPPGAPSSTFVPRPCGEPLDQKQMKRGKKVRFKQRYPTPQQMKEYRNPSEIEFHYRTEKPSNNLWLSMPKKDLKELLDAVTGPSMQRRNNACGALKVLSTQRKNQLTLVRTQGFMESLVFAIGYTYSNKDGEAGASARARAVNVVLNVAAKKDNRYPVVKHPGLGDSLVKCMIEDQGEARELACATLATLAKSQPCREPLGSIEKLANVLAIILKGDEPSNFETDVKSRPPREEKADYDEFSHSISGSYTSASSSSSHSSFGEDDADDEETLDTIKTLSTKEDPEVKNRTRMNACAALMHLSKECCISRSLCASNTLLFCLVATCNEVESPIHTKSLEILANLTRFPHNNARMVEFPGLVDCLILNGKRDKDNTDRLWSMRILQNLSSERTAKIKLAEASVLELLSTSMMRSNYEEQLAATSAMYNLSTDPGAVVPLTNTKNVVATLVHVAHNPKSMAEVRTIACDALATIGLWLQTLASAGTVPEDIAYVPLPSYLSSGWKRWGEGANQ